MAGGPSWIFSTSLAFRDFIYCLHNSIIYVYQHVQPSCIYLLKFSVFFLHRGDDRSHQFGLFLAVDGRHLVCTHGNQTRENVCSQVLGVGGMERNRLYQISSYICRSINHCIVEQLGELHRNQIREREQSGGLQSMYIEREIRAEKGLI